MKASRHALPRIFFDTNDGSIEGGYELKFDNSLKDIEGIGRPLTEGEKVVIYMPDELEYIATLKFDSTYGYWVAIPIPETLRYLDGSTT